MRVVERTHTETALVERCPVLRCGRLLSFNLPLMRRDRNRRNGMAASRSWASVRHLRSHSALEYVETIDALTRPQ
jgi:hypothetical protein